MSDPSFGDWVRDAVGGPGHLRFRRARLRVAAHAAAVPLIVAVIMDSIPQVDTLRILHPGWALAVGAALVAIPYAIARALGDRAVAAFGRHRRMAAP